MAAVDTTISEHRRPGVRRQRKHHLRIDMTPMVDLGFLLISFFIITTTMQEPHAMKVYMPHDGPSTPTKTSTTITILTGSNDRLYYYYGEEKDAIADEQQILELGMALGQRRAFGMVAGRCTAAQAECLRNVREIAERDSTVNVFSRIGKDRQSFRQIFSRQK